MPVAGYIVQASMFSLEEEESNEQENQEALMNSIGPLYLKEQQAKGMKITDKDGNDIA